VCDIRAPAATCLWSCVFSLALPVILFSSRDQKYESAMNLVVVIILVMTEKCIFTRVSDRNGEAKV